MYPWSGSFTPRYCFWSSASVRTRTHGQWWMAVFLTFFRSSSIGYSVDFEAYWFEIERTASMLLARARSRYASICSPVSHWSATLHSTRHHHVRPARVTPMRPSGRTFCAVLEFQRNLDERLDLAGGSPERPEERAAELIDRREDGEQSRGGVALPRFRPGRGRDGYQSCDRPPFVPEQVLPLSRTLREDPCQPTSPSTIYSCARSAGTIQSSGRTTLCTVIADETLHLYEALVATRPGLERKGRSMPYTSINGHMFSFLAPDGTLALRLPDADRDAFLERYETTLVEQHGHVLKEYVAVPAGSPRTAR